VHGWDDYKVRTEHNRSPLQILYEGLDLNEAPVDIDYDSGVEDAEVEEYQRRIVDPLHCPLLSLTRYCLP
jgi:hypothetical protein